MTALTPDSVYFEVVGVTMFKINERLLTLQECTDEQVPTGRFVTFKDIEFSPLKYSDLLKQTLNKPIVFSLDWSNARVVESNIPRVPVDDYASANSILECSYSCKAIALIKGGWLPFGLVVEQGMTVFPDKCIVSELRGSLKMGLRPAVIEIS